MSDVVLNDLPDVPDSPAFIITVGKATGTKCERCWNYRSAVGTFSGPSDALRSLCGGGSLSTSVRYLLLGFLSLAIVVMDQVTKVYVMQTMRLHESIPVIADFFGITYIRNPGAAFGFLSSSSGTFRFVFFGLTSIFAVGLLGTILVRMPKR